MIERVRIASAILGILALGYLLAQPPAGSEPKGPLPPAPKGFPREEEDPLSPGIAKKIEIDDDAPDVTVPKGAAYFKLGTIARLAANTREKPLAELYARYAVAYDRIIEQQDSRRTRVCPLPVHRSQKYPARFGAFVLSANNVPSEFAKAFEMGRVQQLRHFEELVIEEAQALTRKKDPSSRDPLDQLPAALRAEAAETLLTATLFVHDTAREQGKRRGKGWEDVTKQLTTALAETRDKRLQQAVADQDWTLARKLGQRIIDIYGETPARLEAVYAAKLSEAEAILEAAGEQATELQKVYAAVSEYEARSPTPDRARVKKIRDRLSEVSKKMIDRASDLQTRDPSTAGRLVTDAGRFDPENPKLAELRSILNVDYSVLVVGYRRLPERMSPSLARYDSEKHAVELLFEGLTDPLPDEKLGMGYRPVLAIRKPDVVPNGRAFELQRAAVWAGGDRAGLDAADIRGTVDLLRRRPDSWAAYPLDWIADVRADDPSRVRILLKRGHIDPRAVVSFKILPARWLIAQGKQADDIAFGAKPFGTGPYALADAAKPGEVLFRANPAYGRRPERPGQPAIKEIRFVDISNVKDLAREFVNERIHMIPDLPTQDVATFKDLVTTTGKKAFVATAKDNRQVTILALNHRTPMLRDPALRRGLAHAIDREGILDQVYRVTGLSDKPHAAMNGPFPPNSWATPRATFANPAAKGNALQPGQGPPPLFNRDLAAAKFGEYLKQNGAKNLNLMLPADDLRARLACERIKKQIEEVAKGEGGAITITLLPTPPGEFFRKVQEEHGYDLAYWNFDYPDDWFPFGLGAALDPTAANRNGRNLFGYLVADPTVVPSEADRQLGKTLAEARLHGDPARLTALAADIHMQFNEAMPFVPLWQLDRHIVVSSALKPILDDAPRPLPARNLDPARLFSNVSKWRVE